ncbi:MAG TPA: DUF4389 domain-containing protein [Candidatus Limnocylindrales bacterium]|nr:DUF4389 domain-containing protein [Candidatus Limnocylindrales bacterium]
MSVSNIPVTPPVYPANLMIDYPDRKLNRLTSFFRIFAAIPICIIIGLISNGVFTWGDNSEGWQTVLTAGGILFLPLVLMILFRAKYPKWWFDWNLAFTRFSYRVSAYVLLLRDEYPSTDEEQAVHLELVYPDAQTQLGRGWPLVKWFLAIPHYIVLLFLAIALFGVWIITWFAVLFTGRYPRGLFDFTSGVLRWGLRVEAYAFLLITDKYPPFSLEA